MITLRLMTPADILLVVDKCAQDNWPKPASTFEAYLYDQIKGERTVCLAFFEAHFAGYVTLKITSAYPFFSEHNIPEINDLNVLPSSRRKGIGSALLAWAEQEAQKHSTVIGLGVGLYDGYGNAQQLYCKRGYLPDGLGITYKNQRAVYGTTVEVDDDLILWFVKKLR